MNKIVCLGIAALGLLSVVSCGSATKEKLGLSKKAPDEFMVVPRAPLSLPPEYDLRPVVDNKVSAADDTDLTSAEKSLIEQVNKAQ